MDNPLDTYLSAKEKNAALKQAEAETLWGQWKENPTKQNLGLLLKHFEPEINTRITLFKAKNVNKAAFRADLTRNAVTAIETFNPDRGASLKTHVTNHLRRSQRFNAMHQNMAYIPEEMSGLITPIQKAHDFLYQENGSAPSHGEIATYLNDNPGLVRSKRMRNAITAQLVKRVDDYQIADINGSSFESDPYSKAISPAVETLGLLHTVLKPDEKDVFEYLYGMNGKPKIESTGALATKMGRNPSQISRIKKRIESQFKKYL